jgi:hypothetical protein
MARAPTNLDRTVTRKAIATCGDNFAVTNIGYTKVNTDRIGRQSQTWVKFS